MKVFNHLTNAYGDVIAMTAQTYTVLIHGGITRIWRKYDCYEV